MPAQSTCIVCEFCVGVGTFYMKGSDMASQGGRCYRNPATKPPPEHTRHLVHRNLPGRQSFRASVLHRPPDPLPKNVRFITNERVPPSWCLLLLFVVCNGGKREH